jgi:hypothetical protein
VVVHRIIDIANEEAEVQRCRENDKKPKITFSRFMSTLSAADKAGALPPST